MSLQSPAGTGRNRSRPSAWTPRVRSLGVGRVVQAVDIQRLVDRDSLLQVLADRAILLALYVACHASRKVQHPGVVGADIQPPSIVVPGHRVSPRQGQRLDLFVSLDLPAHGVANRHFRID